MMTHAQHEPCRPCATQLLNCAERLVCLLPVSEKEASVAASSSREGPRYIETSFRSLTMALRYTVLS
jgi:hypothetical protein